jgi:hypothetical protein
VREPRFGCIESIVEIGMLRQLTRHSVSNIARMTVVQRVVFAWLAVILTLLARLLATLAGGPLVRALFQCFAFVPAPTSWIVNGSEMWTGTRFEKGCYLFIFSLRGETVLERLKTSFGCMLAHAGGPQEGPTGCRTRQ